MTWGWKRIDKHTYRFDDRWSVVQDWASHRWYATRDGKYCLVDFANPEDAIKEAERLRKEDKLYARAQQLECAAYIENHGWDEGAALGMSDWLHEEILLEREAAERENECSK